MPVSSSALAAKVSTHLRGNVAARAAAGDPRAQQLDAELRKHVLAMPFEYYDRFQFTTYTKKGNETATNFAGASSPITFFDTHDANKHGYAITSNTGGKSNFDTDFLAGALAIDVSCPGDFTSTVIGGVTYSTAQLFAEIILNHSAFILKFGDKVALVRTPTGAPSGGGLHLAGKTRTQQFASDTDGVSINNGAPTAESIRMLEEEIVFHKDDVFTQYLDIGSGNTSTQGPLAVLQALAPLTGNFTAQITIRWIGVRGVNLLQNVPKQVA